MNSTVIENARQYIEEIFAGNTDGHDAAHSLRVYKIAMEITEAYPDCNKERIALAALLHDVDDHKLFHTENNANARSFLKSQNVPDDETEQIITMINSVSFSKNRGKKPATLEGMIVQDGDRLDAIGAIGVARTFAYGGKKDYSMDETLAHFYEKLLLLKDEMNTDEAKAIAEKRHAFMEDFLKEYYEETGQEKPQ